MPASQSDFFKKAGASTVTTLSAPGKALGATSLTVGSTTNYPTDTGIIVAIRVVDTSGNLVAGTYTEWSATVSSGTSLAIDATPVYGSDQIYAAGSTTQVFIPLSSYATNKMIDGLLVEHEQDGKHSDITANTITSPSIATDSIAGITDADSGTVFGVGVVNGKISDTSIDFTTLDFGNYSTSEVDTGFTWVDGKHVYKKTVSCGGLPNNTTKNTAHGITNIQAIVASSGITYTSLGGTQYTIPLITSTNRAELAFSSTNIIIVTNFDATAFANTYITLLYTRN